MSDWKKETVWLSQAQMVELFQTTKQNISLHIKNVYEEGELDENSTVKDYLTVQTEDGQTKIDIRLEEETEWLLQAQMVELFQAIKQNVSLHIRDIFKEGELGKI